MAMSCLLSTNSIIEFKYLHATVNSNANGVKECDGQFESYGIAISANGKEVYVTDMYNHRVQVFDTNGRFIRKFGSYGSGNDQLACPFGIAVTDTTGCYC